VDKSARWIAGNTPLRHQREMTEQSAAELYTLVSYESDLRAALEALYPGSSKEDLKKLEKDAITKFRQNRS